MKEFVGRTIAREILRSQIFYDDLGNDGLTWAFSPLGTYALKVHSGSVTELLMLTDARTLPIATVVNTDVCVIGAGPAGLALAHELSGQDFQVCLLESGGLEADAATQSLCMGETTGDTYSALEILRRCQCGGTAND